MRHNKPTAGITVGIKPALIYSAPPDIFISQVFPLQTTASSDSGLRCIPCTAEDTEATAGFVNAQPRNSTASSENTTSDSYVDE